MPSEKWSEVCMDEQLSSLLDNELDAKASQRALTRIAQEPALQAAWTRQHLLKAVLAGEDRVLPAADFADRVMASLYSEGDAKPPSKKVVSLVRPRKSRVLIASGLAMAASVMAVTVVLKLMPLHSPSSTEGVTLVSAAESPHFRKVASDAEIQREMEEYLLEHQRLAARHGLTAPRGYMRMATPGFTHVSYSGE